ncbi:hypothetical protein EBR21_13975, partial [bacterium]|nr:hypothetical protein [bacterium]
MKSGRGFFVTLQVFFKGKQLPVNDKLKVKMSGTGPLSPWKESKLPFGEFECVFLDGKCIVPNAPFTVNGRGKLLLVAEDPLGKISKGSAEFEVVESDAKFLVLSSTGDTFTTPCNSDVDKALLELDGCQVRFSSDSLNQTLYAYVLDEGGSPLKKVAANWNVTGTVVPKSSTASVEQTVLDIAVAGKGVIEISTSNLKSRYFYQVDPGAPAKIEVMSENGGIESVVTPFRARVKVFDQQNNVCTNYKEPINLDFLLKNAPASPNGSASVVEFSEPVVLNDGVAYTQGKFHAKLATTEVGAPSPVISVVMNSKEFLSDNIIVRPGIETSAKLRSTASNSGSELDPTAVITMKASDRYFVYVAGYDAYGNYVKDLAATFIPSFKPTSDFSYSNGGVDYTILTNNTLCATVPSLPCPLVNNAGTNTMVTPPAGLIGGGMFTAVPTTLPAVALQSPTFAFVTDRAEKLVLETEHRTGGVNLETAGVPFTARIVARDIYNNVVGSFAGSKSVAITAVLLKNSWLGRTPEIPASATPTPVSCQFINGVCTLTGWVLADTREPTILNISEETIQSTPSQFVTVKPGEPSEVVMVEDNPNTTPLNQMRAVRDLKDPDDINKSFLPVMTTDASQPK